MVGNIIIFKNYLKLKYLNLLWNRDELDNVETGVDEDGASEVSLQHLVSLLAVSLLYVSVSEGQEELLAVF